MAQNFDTGKENLSIISKNYLEQTQVPIFTKDKLEKLTKQLETFHIQKRCFGKHHSQFMDLHLILSKVTPIRNARQALAHIERSYQAIKENEYRIKKNQNKLLQKQESLKKCNDPLKRKYINIEIEELEYGLNASVLYFEGALKTIQTYIDAYEQICKEKGIEHFTEEDFEKQEEEYHIKTALLQSLRSVRINGKIDLGNQEYLEQCGINPSVAEKILQGFLNTQEHDISMKTTYKFLDECFKLFKDLSNQVNRDIFGIKEKFSESALFLGSNKNGQND